jgi:protein-arginine deiminase
MPAAGGRAQTMRVMFRSHQDAKESGRLLYEILRGPDVGVTQRLPSDEDSHGDGTLDSTGNMETIPPYTYHGHSYPAGRVIMGQATFFTEGREVSATPSPSVVTFLNSQGLQDPLILDTSGTEVEHVDEIIQFLPAATARGWRVAAVDPDAGMKLLRDAQTAGHGALPVTTHDKGEKTIDELLNDPDRLLESANAKMAKNIAANLDLIKRETGVTDSEIVHVPTLFADARLVLGADPGDPDGRHYPDFSEVPDAVNGVVLGPDRYLAPKQWGPVINGRDIFADAVSTAYRAAGMKVTFIDDWFLSQNGGDVHCGTNTLRDATAPWWR